VLARADTVAAPDGAPLALGAVLDDGAAEPLPRALAVR